MYLLDPVFDRDILKEIQNEGWGQIFISRNLVLVAKENLALLFIDRLMSIASDVSDYPDVKILELENKNIHFLFGSGWYDFEPPYQVRWMQQTGTVIMTTAESQQVWLQLLPRVTSSGQGLTNRGELSIVLNDVPIRRLPIVAGQPIALPLVLQPGSNVVTLHLAAPAYNPQQHDPAQPDSRNLGVAWAPITISGELDVEED